MISVITICKNCIEDVRRTVDSVLSQDFLDLEYIVIDGASTDGTIEMINNDYIESIDYFISELDQGISDAFNKGIKAANGDLLLFLNAGDSFLSNDVLKNAWNDWKKNEPDILFYQVKKGSNGYSPKSNDSKDGSALFNRAEIPHQATFIKRKVFDRVGAFDLNYKIRMDYDFFLRCAKANCSCQYIPRKIVNYQLGGTSMKEENAKLFYKEGISAQRSRGFTPGIKDYVYLLMPGWVRNLGRIILKR